MKGDYRIPKEIPELNLMRAIGGVFVILIGIAFYFLIPDDLIDNEIWNGVKLVIAFIMICAGLVLILMGNDKSMTQYFVSKNGKCRLAGEEYSCMGNCRECVFAAAYLENEFRNKKEE
jgi:hypothetical protein